MGRIEGILVGGEVTQKYYQHSTFVAMLERIAHANGVVCSPHRGSHAARVGFYLSPSFRRPIGSERGRGTCAFLR